MTIIIFILVATAVYITGLLIMRAFPCDVCGNSSHSTNAHISHNISNNKPDYHKEWV